MLKQGSHTPQHQPIPVTFLRGLGPVVLPSVHVDICRERQNPRKSMKNGLETENWVCKARAEELERGSQSCVRGQVGRERSLLSPEPEQPCPGGGSCWPRLLAPFLWDRCQACMWPFVPQFKGLTGVSIFLSREFSLSWLLPGVLERKPPGALLSSILVFTPPSPTM